MSGSKKYILSFGIAVLVFLVLQYALKNFVSNTNVNYILSSITQGLASLVALLFVIIFFLCQSIRRISILDQILKPDGYSILFIFVASIIFPLIIMRIGYTAFQINFSIFLCVFSLSLLFPFIISVNETFKEFGIRNIIADLQGLNISDDYLKYRELLDDLLMIKPEEIVKLEPKMIIDDITKELSGKVIRTKYISKYYKKAFTVMLARIGILCFKDKEKKQCFDNIKKKFGNDLSENCTKKGDSHYGPSYDELFHLYLTGLSELVSNIKFSKGDENDRYSFVEILIKTSFLNFNQFNGESDERQKILKEKILSFYKKGKIIRKDIEKAWKKLRPKSQIGHIHIEEGIKDKFEKYLKKLLEITGSDLEM